MTRPLNRCPTTIITAAAALALVGCKPAVATDQMPAAKVSTGRFTMERAAVIDDPLAYRGQRGIYVIRDRQTGTEFIGVSGVGVAEAASHQSGKTRVSHEQ